MNFFRKLFSSLLRDEAGNTATEYGIMLALIVLFCLTAVFSTGELQEAMWTKTATKVQSIVPP